MLGLIRLPPWVAEVLARFELVFADSRNVDSFTALIGAKVTFDFKIDEQTSVGEYRQPRRNRASKTSVGPYECGDSGRSAVDRQRTHSWDFASRPGREIRQDLSIFLAGADWSATDLT